MDHQIIKLLYSEWLKHDDKILLRDLTIQNLWQKQGQHPKLVQVVTLIIDPSKWLLGENESLHLISFFKLLDHSQQRFYLREFLQMRVVYLEYLPSCCMAREMEN